VHLLDAALFRLKRPEVFTVGAHRIRSQEGGIGREHIRCR